MTCFVLVAEAHTGAWVWEDLVARLEEAGCAVHAVAFGGGDLDTQVGELVRLVDRLEGRLVMVGHGYGIHPVLGAADRRAGRVERVVYLDVGIPQDGQTALALVPDPGVRERMRDGVLPPPANAEEWERWGSLAGVSAEGVERLVRRGVAQPAQTLTQPLRLSGAAEDLPTTGVLCTENGSSIAVVQALVGFGDPRLRKLVDERVSFFELGTGHWPMLSCPEELAEVLRKAAAGEGRRLVPPEEPAHLRPFLLQEAAEGRPRERYGRVDLYPPGGEGGPCPAVVLVHGGPLPAEARPTPRDWPMYVGYGRYLASQGVFGVTVDHRLHGLGDYARAAEDVAEAVALVRADPRVDAERVALWFFSGGGLLAADWLAAPPPWLRCVAATYPVLAPLPNWSAVEDRFRPSPSPSAAAAHGLPIVLTRVGLESPEIAATVERFLARASAETCEVIDVPNAHHGFETIDHTAEARSAVQRAVGSVLRRLRA